MSRHTGIEVVEDDRKVIIYTSTGTAGQLAGFIGEFATKATDQKVLPGKDGVSFHYTAGCTEDDLADYGSLIMREFREFCGNRRAYRKKHAAATAS